LSDCNLHTIVRLPETSFFPATVSTTLLFFEKGEPTKEIWYYQHALPKGQKSYSKTKPLEFDEFSDLISWWDNRVENEFAWKVSVEDIVDFNLDIKHPKVEKKQNIDIKATTEQIVTNLESLKTKVSKTTLLKEDNEYEIKSIGEFLNRIKDTIDLNDQNKYKRVTIKTNHKGIHIRDTVFGSKIGTKRQFIVQPGQFLLSKIDARNGAFGIVPAELNDAIITGNFWTYVVNEEIVDIQWFLYFTQSHHFIEICKSSSTGSTHRKYLNEQIFLNHQIQVPSLKTQKEVVQSLKQIKDGQRLILDLKDSFGLLMEGYLNNYF